MTICFEIIVVNYWKIPHFFSEYDQPHESQTNKDIMDAITRKGLGGLCGPDSPEGDGDYPLHDSPRNDSTNQNDNEYLAALQNRNQINSAGGNYIVSHISPLYLFVQLHIHRIYVICDYE